MKMKGCVVFIVFLLVMACSGKEKEEKIDLQQVKENREGLDYRDRAEHDIFSRLDELLKQWHNAQRTMDPYAFDIERELNDLSRSYFSEIVNSLRGEKGYIAAAALGFTEDIRAIPYLIEVLEKGPSSTRSNAAMSIGHIGSNQTPMEPLFKSLQEDPEGSVRSMVAFAIAQIVKKEKDEGALPHLLRALKDSSPAVRNNVVMALEKIGNEEGAKAILSSSLYDEHPLVRYNSIRAMGTLKRKDAVVPIIKLLRDPVADVRGAAHAVLQNLTGKKFGPEPGKWEEWADVPSTPVVPKTPEK